MVKEILEAKSFAVIGASEKENSVGHIVFKNLLNSNVKVFPVNPNVSEILGEKCYKSVLDLPGKIDCAIIVVNVKIIAIILKEICKKGIKGVVVISSGFSEIGNDNIEEKIKCFSNEKKIKLLGPNVLGFVNPLNKVNASFFEGDLKKGKITFLSQSGAIGVAVLDMNLGLSGFVSLGNMACLDFSDFIEYYSKNKDTEKIVIYMESLKPGKGKRFIEVCKKCNKPIVVLKSGKSEVGKKAASSHTASLASEKGIYEGIFKQCQVKEVDSISELFNLKKSLNKKKINLKKGENKACIITNAGGLGVLTSDYCHTNNIDVVEIPKEVGNKLNRVLPICWSHNNPVDILGDAQPDRFEKVFEVLENESFFDFYLILLTPQYMTNPKKTAEILLKLKKPVIACFMGSDKINSSEKILENKIPFFKEPFDMCKEVGDVLKY